MSIVAEPIVQLKIPVTTSKDKHIFRKLLDFEILFLLGHSPHSGYSLRKALQREFGNNVSFGTVYPHLQSLENRGLIAATGQQSMKCGQRVDESPATRKNDAARDRRRFVLTPKGAAEYTDMENELFLVAEFVRENSPMRKIATLTLHAEVQ